MTRLKAKSMLIFRNVLRQQCFFWSAARTINVASDQYFGVSGWENSKKRFLIQVLLVIFLKKILASNHTTAGAVARISKNFCFREKTFFIYARCLGLEISSDTIGCGTVLHNLGNTSTIWKNNCRVITHLLNHRQYVRVVGQKSSQLLLKCSFPTGSLVALTQFPVFINNIPEICDFFAANDFAMKQLFLFKVFEQYNRVLFIDEFLTVS